MLKLSCDEGVHFLVAMCSITAVINTRDSDGRTLLHYACAYNHVKMLRMLLEAGADAGITCAIAGATPLIEAAKSGAVGCMRHLLTHEAARATINARDRDGCTAFQHVMNMVLGGHTD